MAHKSRNRAITRPGDISRTDTEAAQRVNAQLHFEASFSGPLPDPATLKAYDLALPGLAERIVSRWEQQTDHRMKLETVVINGDNKRANWGLVSATLISLCVLGVCALLAMHNHETTAAVLAAADIAALAGVFIYGSNVRKQERIERTKLMTGQTLPSAPGKAKS